DIREAPALVLIDDLLKAGATARAHDPEAMDHVRAQFGDRISLHTNPMEALDGADGLAIMTEWSEFRTPDFAEMATRLKRRVIFDGRNLYDLETMQEAGFDYFSIGRPPIRN
ncbi:MAG TPA: UDP-glucose/GDP-mannose dehydrogenase family protein, partial [Pirellulaceae bacterium]